MKRVHEFINQFGGSFNSAMTMLLIRKNEDNILAMGIKDIDEMTDQEWQNFRDRLIYWKVS